VQHWGISLFLPGKCSGTNITLAEGFDEIAGGGFGKSIQ
jgi:hypothetical protein